MTLHRSQGRLRPQPPRVDELPDAGAVAPAPVARRSDGTVMGSEAARMLGARGGKATRRRARALDLSGGGAALEGQAGEAWRAAQEFADAQRKELESGTGPLSPATRALLEVAALQGMASKLMFAKAAAGEDASAFIAASRMGDAMRQSLLVVVELSTRDAARRADGGGGATPTALAALAAITAENARHARDTNNDDNREGTDE